MCMLHLNSLAAGSRVHLGRLPVVLSVVCHGMCDLIEWFEYRWAESELVSTTAADA